MDTYNEDNHGPAPSPYPTWEEYCAETTAQFCWDAQPPIKGVWEKIPSLAANAIFAALFSASLLAFIITYFRARKQGTFFTVMMCLGLFCEAIGYIGRAISANNPWDDMGFMVQIVCLTIGPAFLAAGVYTCLAKVVSVYGEECSRLPARWYTRIFIPCDVVSLVLQAAGGGIAAASDDIKLLNMGNNIMIAGLSFQVFILAVFVAVSGEFLLRVHNRKKTYGPDSGFEQAEPAKSIRGGFMFKGIIVALAVSTIAIFWRSCFRVAELSEGWNGPLMSREDLFIGFESVMIAIAVVVLNVFNPCMVFDVMMSSKWRKEGGFRKSESTANTSSDEELSVLRQPGQGRTTSGYGNQRYGQSQSQVYGNRNQTRYGV
ncbi:RTA1 like protein-domain-containing protein [Triangularia verruculosa]|uniref:RTA1 like protein-domain-containing protein n=1 Tax=Triangularia verruculosa TaxID=2587418 RepID=A0AAN6X6H1_9PEZI|nr:RTA1 like protein-domain-containing protein [Triangularia verruculosa]